MIRITTGNSAEEDVQPNSPTPAKRGRPSKNHNRSIKTDLLN